MIAPLKVPQNQIPTTFLGAGTIYEEQCQLRAKLRALSCFAEGDLPKLPASMQNALRSAATGVKLEEVPVYIGSRDLASQVKER